MDFLGKYALSIDVDAFLVFWPKYCDRIRDICEADSGIVHTEWSEDIDDMLIPLRLFPTKVKRGKKAAPQKEPFLVSCKKFIVFAEVRKIKYKY